MEAMRCLDYIPRLSTALTTSKGIPDITRRDGLAAEVAGYVVVLSAKGFRGSTLGFLAGFTSISFSVFGYDHKGVEV